MSLKLMIFVSCLAALMATVTCQRGRVCGYTTPIWRNNNRTCPERAICGDVFDNFRDWRNGTTCYEKRILSNCFCAGNTVCPFENPDHELYNSRNHKRYMCEPKCNLPWCNNVVMAPDGRRGDQGTAVRTAMTAEQRAQEFGGKTYYRMDCMCPRHIEPAFSSRRRAVRAIGHRWNYVYRRYATLYVCDARWNDPSIEDPCPRS